DRLAPGLGRIAEAPRARIRKTRAAPVHLRALGGAARGAGLLHAGKPEDLREPQARVPAPPRLPGPRAGTRGTEAAGAPRGRVLPIRRMPRRWKTLCAESVGKRGRRGDARHRFRREPDETLRALRLHPVDGGPEGGRRAPAEV